MKTLTAKELCEAPVRIQMVYLWCLSGTPIGIALWNLLLQEHPEYFPDEIEYRRKWDSIPEKVKNAQAAEYNIMLSELTKEYPAALQSGGLFWQMRNGPENRIEFPSGKDISRPATTEYIEWEAASKAFNAAAEALETQIYNKHFAPFGLTR